MGCSFLYCNRRSTPLQTDASIECLKQFQKELQHLFLPLAGMSDITLTRTDTKQRSKPKGREAMSFHNFQSDILSHAKLSYLLFFLYANFLLKFMIEFLEFSHKFDWIFLFIIYFIMFKHKILYELYSYYL